MKNKSHFFFLILVLFLATSPAHAQRVIKKCGDQGTKEVERAALFLERNLQVIFQEPTLSDLTSKEKEKLLKKVQEINIKCLDNQNVCDNHNNRLGVERNLLNTAIVICYDRIRDYFGSKGFCGLSEVILHEVGHSAGVEKDRGHNDGPNNDRVYRLGYAASELCDNLGLNRALSRP